MKKIIAISLLFLAACSSIDHGFDSMMLAQKYVPGTEDLPVYDGFQPIEAKNVVYDSESGRIVDAAYSRSGIVAEDVRSFYSETLPQLGWKKNKSLNYIRDGESLKINVTEKKGVVFLKFVIRPLA